MIKEMVSQLQDNIKVEEKSVQTDEEEEPKLTIDLSAPASDEEEAAVQKKEKEELKTMKREIADSTEDSKVLEERGKVSKRKFVVPAPSPQSKSKKQKITQNDFDTKLSVLKCQICQYRTSRLFNMMRHIKAQHVVVEEKDEIFVRSLKAPIVFDNIAIVPISFLNQCKNI